MKLTAIAMLVIYIAYSTLCQNEDITLRQKQYCSGLALPIRNYSNSEIEHYRTSRSNIHNFYYKEIFEYYNSPNSTLYIQAMKWPTALLLTLLCLTVLSIAFFAFSMIKLKKSFRNGTLFKTMIIFGGVIASIIFLLFITTVVFIGLSVVSQRNVNCQFLNVENFLLEGFNNSQTGNYYPGLQRFIYSISNLTQENQNLSNGVIDAEKIVGLRLSALSESALLSLKNMYSTYRDSMTINPFGVASKPYSIRNMTNYISDELRIEFSDLNYVNTQIEIAARSLLLLQGNVPSVIFNSSASQLISNINLIQNDIRSMGEAVWERGKERLSFVNGGYWTIFSISIAIIALIGVFLAFATSIYRKNSYESKRKIVIIIFFIVTFFVLVYGIVTIILMAGVSAVSTFCKVLSEVNKGNTTILDELAVNFPTYSKPILKECLSGNGNITQFYTNPAGANSESSVVEISNLINGMYVGMIYDKFANKSISSKGISNLTTAYTQIMDGKVEDQEGVFAQLNTLNNLISCSSQTNALSNTTCNNSVNSICTGIKESKTYQVPTCSKSETLGKSIYNSLKDYITSENELLTRLISDLSGDKLSTPENNYENGKAALNVALSSVQSILLLLKKTTLPLTPDTNATLESTKCTAIKQEMIILEDYLCFELNYWIYIILVISAVSFVLLFLLTWILWEIVREVRTKNANKHSGDGPKTLIEKRMMNLNDRETIPNF
jgi:hypothetical protein